MKTRPLIAALVTALALPAAAADPAGQGTAAQKPVAVVNGVALPQAWGEIVRQGRIARGMPRESLSDEAIADSLITAELLSQAAVKQGLDKDPMVQAAIEFQKKDALSKAALEHHLRAHPVTEAMIKAEYEQAKASAGDKEYRARHILVDTEKEARELIASLKRDKKARFEDLAKKHSKDPSNGNGGDLGWLIPGNLVPEFAQVMVGMKKGETTQTPVKSRYGWHVIRLEDTRKLDFPGFDAVKGRIAGQLQQQAIRKYVQELRATAKVE